MIAEVIYALCALVSVLAAVLLLRAYAAVRSRLLLWTTICFVGLALNNVLLFVEQVIVHDDDLVWLRSLPAAIGVSVLVFGLVWEDRD